MVYVKKDVKTSKRCQIVKKMSSCQKDVKLSKRCQIVKKRSNVKKSNTWTMEEVHKKKFDIMTFTHIDVNCDIKYEGHQNCLKTYFYAHFEGFWSLSYVMSKLTSICVNLIVSIYFFFVKTSYIVHVLTF